MELEQGAQEHVAEGGMWSPFSRKGTLLSPGPHPALPVTSQELTLQFPFALDSFPL